MSDCLVKVLRDAGMEVIYCSNLCPEAIVETALSQRKKGARFNAWPPFELSNPMVF
ncbi:MAG: hypothetical protein HY730_02090 [Candidatus Tectomicrobia bacterium]|uniref:Uncharacterized protein n=1 Tax=Tectimicrobiota bacterium TaxID=2528274 RepID=A0A933GKR0_UNCTE|nr:hypothetical protein [Candidatus Tectomicrobia bacterium]